MTTALLPDQHIISSPSDPSTSRSRKRRRKPQLPMAMFQVVSVFVVIVGGRSTVTAFSVTVPIGSRRGTVTLDQTASTLMEADTALLRHSGQQQTRRQQLPSKSATIMRISSRNSPWTMALSEGPTPSMFLSDKNIITNSAATTSTIRRNLPSVPPIDHRTLHGDSGGRFASRTLGFDVSLFSSRKSSIRKEDAASKQQRRRWNDPENWSDITEDGTIKRLPNGWLDDQFFDTNIRNAANYLAAPSRRRVIPEGYALSPPLACWLPWIPTKEQIRSLKRTEMQEACRQRQLPCSGLKAKLQERLEEWAHKEQQKMVQVQASGRSLIEELDYRRNPDSIELPGNEARRTTKKTTPTEAAIGESVKDNPDSLAEWARTVDLEPLLQRRKTIHREKNFGKPKEKAPASEKLPRGEYLDSLARVFEQPSSSSPYSSNKQVKTLYLAAKRADKDGDRLLAQQLLEELLVATPHDGRLYRRLARLHSEDNRPCEAQAVLEEGLRQDPRNPHLWHGLGQLLASSDRDSTKADEYYQRAIAVDPGFPNAYHALGTRLHGRGQVAKAMHILQAGIRAAPRNHRLHHALADLYRDAKMLDMAVRSYKKAHFHGPPVSRGFSYTGLAYCAYENGDVEECRRWLQQAISLNPRQAKAWVALVQMEEAVGNIDRALAICRRGINQYEEGLMKRNQKRQRKNNGQIPTERTSPLSPTLDRNFESRNSTANAKSQHPMGQVPVYRSGDHFFHLYRLWARLETNHGTPQLVDAVYQRATRAFPRKAELFGNWAEYSAEHGYLPDRVQALLQKAADVGRDGRAHQKLAYYVMTSRNDAQTARKLLYRGAMQVGRTTDRGLPELYLTWAVCEWNLEEWNRAEHLLDHAMRLTTSATMRSFLLYSMARLQYCRGEYILAQHCIGLALKEEFPRKVDQRAVWKLWVLVAQAMGNERLVDQCQKQVEGLAALDDVSDEEIRSAMKIEDMTRREPWYFDIHGPTKPERWNRGISLPGIPIVP